MKTILAFSIALGIALVFTAPAPADIIVLNNGQYAFGKVSTAPSGRLKLTTEYGDQFFPRNQVAAYYLTPKGMEAEGYYQAGLVLLNKGQEEAARKFFETCIKYDSTYRDKCIAALKGGPSPAAPASPAAVATAQAPSPRAAPPQTQTQVVRIQCPECSGTGVVMSSTSLREGGPERPRPCPMCGGRGYRDLLIPPGYEICPDCSGFGATMGSGRSDRSSFTLRKEICPRCAGRGIVKIPWKPPEGTEGTGASGAAAMSYSPPPGTSPPHGAYAVATQRARAVASGRQPAPAPPPSTTRSAPPTVVASQPPAQSSYEQGNEEEIINEEEGTGSPSEAAAEESTDESQSEAQSETAPKYEQPGLVGKINKYKWYIVLGGVVLMIFAIVFNKMSAKK